MNKHINYSVESVDRFESGLVAFNHFLNLEEAVSYAKQLDNNGIKVLRVYKTTTEEIQIV